MPIPWREWSPPAFAQAEAENKPVLLSLVAAWSDACAAMDEATFAHPDVVSAVAARVVPVRVDADRRPDLNDRYNLGGWPTTAFLTGSGDLLSGATHLSADAQLAMLQQVADACRDRAAEIAERRASLRRLARDVQGGRLPAPDAVPGRDADHAALAGFRALLVDRFDGRHGGFGTSPKLPHPYALLVALSLAGESPDADLVRVIDVTLDRVTGLWDPTDGGFVRYADGEDWSHPGVEKTLEDNAALLHVHVEAALTGREACRDRAAAIVRWARSPMADQANGGFFNAQTATAVDRTLYVDRNAMMVGACIRAAALFDDIWLRDFALQSLEAVIVPAYKPGEGVAHVGPHGHAPPVRGLLTDQIHVASALIWAHAATGLLPYSMLAAELIQFAIRQMWDEGAGAFRDRVPTDDPMIPFDLNCHAACVLDRLAVLTGDPAYRDRAHVILRSLADAFHQRDLFGAPYALAVREVVDRRPPAGLELTQVDWHLTAEEH